MNYFFIKLNEKESYEKIRFDDVIFIKTVTSSNYSEIHLNDTRKIVSMNLKSIHEKLPTQKFFRCHNSYVVNVDRIEKIIKDEIFFEHTMKTCFISEINDTRNELLRRLNLISAKNKIEFHSMTSIMNEHFDSKNT